MENNNIPVTLNVAKHVKNDIVDKIDESKFLRLGLPETERLYLFNFALALGVKLNERTPFIGGESFVRTANLHAKDWALYNGVYFTKVLDCNKERIDEICDRKAVLKTVEEYANTGFNKIQQLMAEGEDEETLMLRFIGELKDLYKKSTFPEDK